MSALSKRDAIDAAMSLAEDIAESRLDPAALDQDIVDECKALFGVVAGPEDSLWELHTDVCRQALALGALTGDELSEWLAVERSRAGEPITSPQPHIDPTPAESLASAPLSPEIALAKPDLSDGTAPEPEPDPTVKADCGCGSTSPATVVTADGRRIPSRLIIARGRGLPDPGCGPM